MPHMESELADASRMAGEAGQQFVVQGQVALGPSRRG